MTALSADNTTLIKTRQRSPEGYVCSFSVAATTTIYKNSFVALNTTGYLKQYVTSTKNLTVLGDRFVGIALEHVDNSAGADGALTCRVLCEGSIEYPLTSVAIADIGKPVFLSDDNTVAIASAGNDLLGWITDLPAAGTCGIRMNGLASGHNDKLVVGVSPAITIEALNLGMIFHPTLNHNSWLILWAGLYVTVKTEVATTPAVLTIKDSAGTTSSIVFTTINDMAAGDIIPPDSAETIAIGAASNSPMVVTAADKGLNLVVTTAGVDDVATAGAVKCVVLAVAL
jgi:hypothetical protein